MRTASFPWDQLRSTFLHEMSASPVPGFPPLSTNFWPVVLHRIEMRIVFFTFFPFLSSFYFLFFSLRELWILISFNRFYEDIFFQEIISIFKKSLNYFELDFMNWLHLLFEKIDTSLIKNKYLNSKGLSKCYMIIGLIGM